MSGQWVVVLWAIVGLIFLLKIPGVRDCFAKLRKMSVFGIICVVVSLGILADVSYTKDGVRTNQATALPPAPSIITPEDVPNTPAQTLQSPSLPAWWKYDPTDTDGDGIPDLWEKWTHGNPLVADSHLDRDGDGLTDLEEFWNQTDPRTADTDGDGFDDGFEVAHGMNPLVSEDFTPNEPDTNTSGLPDIWEAAGYISSFRDTNNNGFDDFYEQYDLPVESDDNFDVLVNIYSTRSALLTWGDGERLVVLASANTTVRLRLPFGEDTEFRLLPAPEGIDLPAGELWKSRMQVSFAPRSRQRITGNAVVSIDGLIAHKVVNTESVITRFGTASPSSNFQPLTLSGGGAGNENPKIEIKYRQIGIKPIDAAWHFVGELIGPFTVTNHAGTMPHSITWDAAYASVRAPLSGPTACIEVTSHPPSNDTVSISAISALDGCTVVTNTLAIPKCAPGLFGVIAATRNFSPHLGETASFTLSIKGCAHFWEHGWLEAELMRETTTGWQHVSWLDASHAQPGHQKRRQCLAGPQPIFWGGIAIGGAASSKSPDTFTHGVTPFRRALPQVISGEPVPPPYYTIFFRYRDEDSDSAEILAETSTKIYVPQVVKVEMTDEAYEEFKLPILYPETFYPHLLGDPLVIGCESNVLLYAGCPDITKTELLSEVVRTSQSLYPSGVNIRFTAENAIGRIKTVVVQCDYSTNAPLGRAMTRSLIFPNAIPSGNAYVNMNVIRADSSEEKYYYENDLMSTARAAIHAIPSLFPISEESFIHAVSSTIVHETGHLLGLVSNGYLGGKYNHNANSIINGWIMNNGAYTPCVYHLGNHPNRVRSWKFVNASYLQFILPKGD